MKVSIDLKAFINLLEKEIEPIKDKNASFYDIIINNIFKNQIYMAVFYSLIDEIISKYIVNIYQNIDNTLQILLNLILN